MPTDNPSDVTLEQLLQAQIASAEAVIHLLEQETFGLKSHAGKAARIAFGLPANLPPQDVIEVVQEYITSIQEEIDTACKEP